MKKSPPHHLHDRSLLDSRDLDRRHNCEIHQWFVPRECALGKHESGLSPPERNVLWIPRAMNLWIGTSGFQYTEWKGTFYPEDLSTAKMLPYYAARLTTTEINYSFHRIPSAKTIEGWWKATPERFKFSLKAPQKITHFAKLRDCGDTLRFFHQVICDLEKKLGCVLFQLPPQLKKDVGLLTAFLEEIPLGMRAAFEFRHTSWFEDEIYALLKSKNLALCIADSEKISTPVVATADYGYLRLRREDYQAADVARWADMVNERKAAWSDAFVYFKHEESGIGPKLAQQMVESLATR